MPLALRFRLLAHNLNGLNKAPQILARNLRGGLLGLGKRFRASAQSRMREDSKQEKKSLVIRVEGQGANLSLTVFSTLVQAFVDAYGMKRGKFPPFKRGSRLYSWAQRKSRGIESRAVKLVNRPTRGLSSLTRRPIQKAKRLKRASDSGKPMSRDKRATAKEQSTRRLAFLAARTIFEQGIRPTHWNQRALDANRQQIIREINNALARSANEINRG